MMELIIKERFNGQIIASGVDGQTARIFEGNWYFDPQVATMDNLIISERTYTCPYKGVCNWIDFKTADGRVVQNIGWVYRHMKPGYEFIQDQIGFYSRPTSVTTAEKAADPIAIATR